MQIVIEISKKLYDRYKEKDHIKRCDIDEWEKAIDGCTILPKGHGDLIDADAFLKENKDYTGWILCSDAWGGENAYKDTLEDLINEAPTIIEADRSEEE